MVTLVSFLKAPCKTKKKKQKKNTQQQQNHYFFFKILMLLTAWLKIILLMLIHLFFLITFLFKKLVSLSLKKIMQLLLFTGYWAALSPFILFLLTLAYPCVTETSLSSITAVLIIIIMSLSHEERN